MFVVYRARPISLAYWKLELGHREKREGLADVISIHSVVIIIHSSQKPHRSHALAAPAVLKTSLPT